MFDDRNLVETIMEQPGAALIVRAVQDRLQEEQRKRAEFYEQINEKDKVEFINGEIVYHSQVVKEHNTATGWLYKLLDTFVSIHQLGFVGIEKILIQLTRNDYEPDLCFFKTEKAKDFKKGQMFFPVPDLVVEVLSQGKKSLERDRKIKFDDYEAHGVLEYWIIDPETETIEQYVLEKDQYELLLKSREGSIHSQAVAGFVIPIRAVFEEAANLAALRDILK